MKKLQIILLASIMCLTLISGCSEKKDDKEVGIKDGIYSSQTTGFHDMVVNVEITDGKISNITTEDTESEGYGMDALPVLIEQILEIQGLELDVVSGATLTRDALVLGVVNCLKEAGATEEEISAIKAKKQEVTKEEDIELTADVIVIGAGGAGLAAAVSAHQNGASVIVVEKMAQAGGNTILAGGINAVENDSETAKLYNDSTELHYTQTLEGGDNLAKPELVRILVDKAWEGIEWSKELGVEYVDDLVVNIIGSLHTRGYVPVNRGSTFTNAYLKYADENDNFDVLYKTKANEIIMENGKAVGVEATGETGNNVTLKASKSVVLATGGFGANVEMREKVNEEKHFWPNLGESVLTTNASSATGDGITMAEKVGASFVDMDQIQLHPLCDPKNGGIGGAISNAETEIFINMEGKRFINEKGRRDEIAQATLSQTDEKLYVVVDLRDDLKPEDIKKTQENPNVVYADTLEELADKIKVPSDALIETVNEVNTYFADGENAGKTDKFGRSEFTLKDGVSDGINEGPFYAYVRVPSIHHTMGGININVNTEVLDTNNVVIPGLFACGEVTGGIHGSNRLGGNALLDVLVFGRIAGENAAK